MSHNWVYSFFALKAWSKSITYTKLRPLIKSLLQSSNKHLAKLVFD